MDKKERLNEAFNYLKSKGLVHMQRDVAEKMGATPQNVSLALRGTPAVLTDRFLMRFNNAYFGMFNLDWLITGIGEMLSPTGKPLIADNTVSYLPSVGNSNDGVPFFDLEPAACGEFSGFGEAFTSNNLTSRIVLPDMKAKKGDIFIKTKGRSMVDYEHPELSIPEGAIVLIREWKENYIAWGELYCVMTRSGYAVKRLMPGADDAHVSCVSADSEHYPPYTIALSDIVGIARVIGILTYKTV